MSGLVGFYDEKISTQQGRKRLSRMVDLLTHQSFYQNDNLFVNDGIYCSRSHRSYIQKDLQPLIKNQTYVWFDGEIYNRDSFGPEYDEMADPSFICSLYTKKRNFSFLSEIDGIFSTVIFDSNLQKIYFITDRHGFELLYYYEDKERLAWFSEAKGVLALEYYSPEIDSTSVQDFFNQGYLTEDKSWFKGVQLFSPASVYCWDITQKRITQQKRYWSWNKIQTLDNTIDEKSIIERMGTLFKKAVEKRAYPISDICIPLSGGLDSRAIVAALPRSEESLHTYTFGKHGCWDIHIAKEVSKLRGANHYIVELNENNWFEKRTDGVWWTDGQMNLKHMHVLNLLNIYSKKFKISLNGFLGDAIQGGYYINEGEKLFKKMVMNRGRRFINEGSRLGEAFDVFYRRPFIDNDLFEFTVSLPNQKRKNSYLYNRMLINEFPDYFKNIIWQRTGKTISTSKIKNLFNLKVHAVRNKGIHMMRALGFSYTDYKDLHDYTNWIQQKASLVNEILQNSKTIYPEFIDRQKVFDDWDLHLQGKDRSEKICAYLTFEIFLQQTFEKKFRP